MTDQVDTAWQPSGVQRERDEWRRRRTIRSAAIAAGSTLLLLVVVGGVVVSSPGWERVKETYFDWDKAVSSFPAVLEGLWLNIRVMALCAVLIVALSLTIAVMRTIRGPVAFPLRLVGTAYVDIFRGLPLLLVIFLLGFGGLVVSLWPYVVPRHVTIWDGASDPQTLAFAGTT